MTHVFRAFVITFLLFPALNSNAQNYQAADYQKGLHLKLNDLDEKKFEKAFKLLVEGDQLYAEAQQMFGNFSELEKKEGISSEYEKTMKILTKASEKYSEGNDLIYEIYKTKADHFWESMKKDSHFAAGMEKAKYYERKALQEHKRSSAIRQQIQETDRYEWADYKMDEVLKLEKLIIRDEGRALQLLQDYPVEYNYGWDDDVTKEQLQAAYADPALNEPPEDLLTRKREKKKEKVVINPKDIIFRVQIAAHTIQINDDYLKSIYSGSYKIDEVYEEGWYKYQIGMFKTLEEAEKVLNESQVKKAFVVAYQDGRKLTLHQAEDILQKQKQ